MVLNLPGVFVEEVPFGPPTILGVATSTTAFVGRAVRGPLDEPVTIDSGLIVIEVGFAPVRPAEFVILTIRQRSARQ